VNIPLRTCEVRSWDTRDVDPLVLHANNRNVSINLRDRFPYPYTRRDAREFIKLARNMRPESLFAIAVDGEAVGGIGFVLGHDVERVSTEVGYWLGEAYWGRGIATDALVGVTQYAIATHGFTRLFALPFAYNVASCRVLEKAGYTLEARLRNSAVKDGRICDQLQYAFIASEIAPQHSASLPQR
jgi:RimJ/RimL family protein N-acetyltransferase